jgi:hypothetical protein
MFSKVLLNSLLVTPALLGAALLSAGSAMAADASSKTDSSDAILTTAAISAPEAEVAQTLSLDLAAVPVEQAVPAEQATAVAPVQLAGVPAPAAAPAPAATAVPSVASLEEVAQYSNQSGNSMSQVTSVNQLSDVRPTDWAFQALSRLITNYGCIAGYPDGTFRGNRAMTRYEFAAGLNACLDAISERIAAGGGVTQEDLEQLRRLQQEFQAELATLRGRVDALEARVNELEANQFSTTTKLRGRTIFSLADIFGGDNIAGVEDNNFVFQSRVRLNFDTSFYGTDRLRARLQAGNFVDFGGTGALNPVFAPGQSFPNNQTAFSYSTGTGNTFRLSRLEYYFPVGPATIYLEAAGGSISDIVTTVSPLDDPEQGSLSYFGYNPIYDVGSQGIGAGITFDFSETLQLGGGYLSGTGNDPAVGRGLFGGPYTLFGQLTFKPGPLTVALTYVNAYSNAVAPTIQNSYGASVNYTLGGNFSKINVGGWINYTDTRVFAGNPANLGDGRSWSYAGYLALSDLGSPGSLLGLIVGVPPRTAIYQRAIGGTAFGQDAALHVEAFYRFALTENISITPGLIWLSDPGNNNDNDSVFVGALRTSFSF